MRSLTFVEAGRLEWRDQPEPVISGTGEALVRPVAASICDIDRPLLAGTSPWSGPLAFGHEAVAEVLDVGDAVTAARPGQLVAVSWHINCGSCDRCQRGLTAHCRNVPDNAMYGLPVGGDWGGLFDDIVRVPFADAMLTPVPAGIDVADAVSAGDNLSLGYQVASRHISAGRRRILVLGSAAVGITVTAFAIALGATDVVYLDDNEEHRKTAEALGARVAAGPPDRETGTFDLVVDAAFNPAWLRRALHMLEPEGVVECLGGHFDDVALPLFAMYTRGVTLHVARANNGPDIASTLTAIQAHTVLPSRWSSVVAWDDADQALLEPALKPVAIRDNA